MADVIRSLASSIAVVAWCAAAGFLLVPVSWTTDLGPRSGSCGVPAFYGRGPFVSSLTRGGHGWDDDAAEEIAEQCDDGVAARMRAVAGLTFLSVPALAVWCLIRRPEDTGHEDRTASENAPPEPEPTNTGH